MKRVNFNKITVKNFLSFGNEPVELEFKRGLNIVTGVNRDKSDRQNGIGKSALIESLYFAIFGTTIRELKKDLIPNSFTSGSCEVVLEFDVILENSKNSYKIIRMINPTKLFFYKNGEDVTRDTIKNTEEFIHELINASPSVFENCVIMTLNNTIPFMAKSKVDKRKFIEGIFNLDFFSKMLLTAREDYNQTKRAYDIELNKMEDSEKNLKSCNAQRDTILNNRKNKISVYENRKIGNTKEKNTLLADLEKEIGFNIDEVKSNCTKLKKAKDNTEKQINTLNEEKFKFVAKISNNETTLKKIGTSDDKCPVCLRSIEEHDKQSIQNEIQSLKDIITSDKTTLKELIEKIDNSKNHKKKLEIAIDNCSERVNQYNLNEQKKSNTKDKIKQLDIWIKQLDHDIEELKSNVTEIDPMILGHTSSLETLKASVNQYRFQINLLDTVKFIVSEEGVKSYLVKKILMMFNDRIQTYLTRLDANCLCYFNEYFEEEIVNSKNKICSYSNFSGAERKAVDFACLFTFMDIRRLQGDVTYNISIYDELFDSCLDEKGLELITKIIHERVEKYDECVLVISHRKENIKAATGEVVFLEKRDDVTKRINYNPFV